MKKKVLSSLLFIMFIPFIVNAKIYQLNNLKEDQIFLCNDEISLYTPMDELLDDEDTIYNKYGHFENMYGREFIFIDLDSTSNRINSNGGYSPNSGTIPITCPNDNKERYWKITNIEYDLSLEYFSIQFTAYEKKPNLTITNLINDKEKYTAKKDEELKYSITIKNIGDGKSNDNIIITNVPKGISILEDRISDNGTYEKENNIIKWNKELLDPNQEYTFTYYAKITDINLTEYIGNSSITSNQIKEEVKSNNTVVNIEKTENTTNNIKNPKTDTGNFIIILIVLLISSLLFNLIRKRKKVV